MTHIVVARSPIASLDELMCGRENRHRAQTARRDQNTRHDGSLDVGAVFCCCLPHCTRVNPTAVCNHWRSVERAGNGLQANDEVGIGEK